MRLDCTVTETGLEMHVDGRVFPLNFPDAVWKAYPDKELLADNYAFLKAQHLPAMLDNWEPLEFQTNYPLFKHEITSVFMHYIPFCADVDGRSAADDLRRYLALEYRFRDYNVRYPAARPALSETAVLNMSFGKDSLLTYAVAREIGLPVKLMMSVDNDCPIEFQYKQELAERFSREFDEPVDLIRNDTGVMHRYGFWHAARTESGIGHLITEYFLDAIPFAFHHGARYILLGSEKECDDSYLSSDGHLCYPVFDQSSEWLLEMSKMGTTLAGDRMQVVSLIEPLCDLAIIRILHERYPEIGKYQMSCFPDENEYGKRHFWCGHCSKCARMYLYFRACGIDPAGVGLDTDMFDAEFEDLYPVFGRKIEGGKIMGYDTSPCGRDEQLLAFLLAAQRGEDGALVDLFTERCLAEARARETELRTRFLRVHPSRTLPPEMAATVGSLYAGALDS